MGIKVRTIDYKGRANILADFQLGELRVLGISSTGQDWSRWWSISATHCEYHHRHAALLARRSAGYVPIGHPLRQLEGFTVI